MKDVLRPYFSNRTADLEQHIKFDFFILFLITLSCILYITLTYELPSVVKTIVVGLDYIVLILFVAEFILRFYYSESKKQFWLDKYTYFDAIAIFPFFLGFNTQYFRIIRIFRFLRFSNAYLDYARKDFYISTEKVFLFRIVFSLICILFVSSGLILTIEQEINPNVNSFDDALYFTLVSVTTVGYGDITPLTQIGKIVTMIVIIMGVVLIPYNIGSLLNHITNKQHYKEEECKVCGLYLHEYDARFCKHCGTKLKRVKHTYDR